MKPFRRVSHLVAAASIATFLCACENRPGNVAIDFQDKQDSAPPAWLVLSPGTIVVIKDSEAIICARPADITGMAAAPCPTVSPPIPAQIDKVLPVNPGAQDNEYVLEVTTAERHGYIGAAYVEPLVPVNTTITSFTQQMRDEDPVVTTLVKCDDGDTIDELDDDTHLQTQERGMPDAVVRATITDGPHAGESGCVDLSTILVDGYSPDSFADSTAK